MKGEWHKLTLGEISEITMGQSPDSKSFNNVRIGVPFIQGAADLNKPESELRFTDEPTKFCYFQDILLSVRAPVGKLSISKFKSCIGRGIAAIKGEKILYFLLESKSRNLNDLSQGSTFSCISGQNLNDLDISLPDSKEEFGKISHFLEVIDARISVQRKTIEDLKKERLYYLYSFIEQAFKTYPLIRLDLITSESNEKSTVENQYRIISSTGKGIFFQDQYFNKQASSESNIGYKVLPYGYCTYRPMSDTGSFTFNIQKLCSMSIVSPAYPVFKFINYDSTVALAIMNNSDQFKKKMLKVKEGGTRFTLPFSKLKWLSVPKIPLNKQTKITYLLNIIDRRNEIYDMQLRYLLSIKEYLLKNLFI